MQENSDVRSFDSTSSGTAGFFALFFLPVIEYSRFDANVNYPLSKRFEFVKKFDEYFIGVTT